jgi:hypothetical protein
MTFFRGSDFSVMGIGEISIVEMLFQEKKDGILFY